MLQHAMTSWRLSCLVLVYHVWSYAAWFGVTVPTLLTFFKFFAGCVVPALPLSITSSLLKAEVCTADVMSSNKV